MLLAKSKEQGGQSLQEHTALNKVGAEEISKHAKLNLTELQKKAIKKAAIYHDIGKANKRFQEKLMKVKKKSLELLKHEAISFIFLTEFLKSSIEKGKNIEDQDVFYYAGLATLNHHNRFLSITDMDETSLKIFISKNFKNLKSYVSKKDFIEDSRFVGRSNDGIDAANISLPLEMIKIYSNLDQDFKEYEDTFVKTMDRMNNNTKAKNVEYFIESIQFFFLHKEKRKQKESETLEIYKNFIITKSLFKICDEFASREYTGNYRDFFNKEFNSTFFGDIQYTKETNKVLNKEWKPNEFQSEILTENIDENKVIVLNAGVGSGKTLAAELIKYRLKKSFISYHTPNRLLAFSQAKKEWSNLDDLISANKLRYLKKTYSYFHTIDQLYLSLTGSKREYLFLKLWINGIAVLDEIDIFQDLSSIQNIHFVLKLLKSLKITTVITTATFTNSLKQLIESVNDVDLFPKKEIKDLSVKGTYNTLNKNDIINLIKSNPDKKIGIFCNTVDACVLLSKKLEKSNIQSLLYHSRLKNQIKEKRKEDLLSFFGKDQLKTDLVAIMSPIAEVGIDLSFDIMVTEPAPVRNIEQRCGRLNRWNTKIDSKLFILKSPLMNMMDEKHLPYDKNGSSVTQYDPYFLNIPKLMTKHVHFFKKIEGQDIGYRVSFLKNRTESNQMKDKWFAGILNDDRNSEHNLNNINFKKFNFKPVDIIGLFFFKFRIDSGKEEAIKNIPYCFRNVDAREYGDYSAIPNSMFNGNTLSNKKIDDEDYGIFDKKINELI